MCLEQLLRGHYVGSIDVRPFFQNYFWDIVCGIITFGAPICLVQLFWEALIVATIFSQLLSGVL